MNDHDTGPAISGQPSDSELLHVVRDSSTGFAIITQDPNGIITSWNRGAEKLLGWTEEDAVGRNAAMMFIEEDRAAGVPEHEMNRARSEGKAEDERWHQRLDGSRFWGSGLLMPLADATMGFVKIFRDRTEQHRAGLRLAESEARFRLLATNIPQLVFRSRGSGSRTWGSPQWEVFTGLSQEKSVAFGWLDAVHPDDRAATVEGWKAAQAVGEYHVEHRIRREPDGEYRWHQTRARPVAEGDVDDWVGTSADIHDLRSLKDRQQVLLAELQHRTRNLLAVVQALARQTQRASTSLEDFGTEFASRLRALSRVQGLLAQTDFQEIDLATLVHAELEAHSQTSSDRIRIAGPRAALPATSAQAIGLALHELATNALKYGALAQASGRLSVTWRVAAEDGHERVVVEWVESGVAMPDPGQPRREGYGTELIQRALPYQLKAKTRIEFGPDGVRCWIDTPAASHRDETNHG